MLVVIARYRVRPGRGDEVAALLGPHIAATRAEPGCLAFLVNRSMDDGDRFVLYEQYADEAAFQAHRVSPHFREIIDGRVVPLLDEREWGRYDLVQMVDSTPPPRLEPPP
jgi:quinol monooxygenase YgiN